MTVNVKRLVTPLICLGSGVLTFIFMCLNYMTVYVKLFGEIEFTGVSAYSIVGNFEFASDILSILIAIVGLLLICAIILAIGLIAIGVLGIIKECTGFDLFAKASPNLQGRITTILLKVFFIGNIVLASAYLAFCAMYAIDAVTLEYGAYIPGFGWYFLLACGIASKILYAKLGKKFENEEAPVKNVYKCSACGTTAKEGDRFCYQCGAPIVVAQAATENASANPYADPAETPYNTENSNNSADNTNNYSTYNPYESNAYTPYNSNNNYAAYNENNNNAVYNETNSADNNDSETVNDVQSAEPTDFYAQVSATQNAEPQKKQSFFAKIFKNKFVLIAATAILLLAIVAIIVVCIFSCTSSNYLCLESDVSYRYIAEDNETVLIVDGELFETRIDGKVTTSTTSFDGNTVIFGTAEGTVYSYYDGKLTEVDDAISNLKLAAEGEALLYINDSDELILYTFDDGKKQMITDELIAKNSTCYHISPDGKSVIFAEGDTTNEFTLKLYSDGKATDIDDNLIPLGVSNNAEFIYYAKQSNNALYVLEEGEEPVKLANSIDSSVAFNADHTQIFFVSGGKYYISIEGGDKIKISSNGIRQIGDYNDRATVVDNTAPIKDFENIYFTDSNGDLLYLNGDFEITEIADKVSSFKTSESDDVIYYMSNSGDLYRGEGYDDKFELVAEDVKSFVITSDGSGCYYINDDNSLYYVKKANDPEKIADDVHSVKMTYDDYALFLTDYTSVNGGTLYSSHNGGEKERVADDVATVSVGVASSEYVTGSVDETTIYVATKKANFEKLLEI